ncbi:MAG: hypothetical protein RLZZ299_1533 [Pseudomonadota bacterium]|jgi:outer membrane protein
MAARLLLPLLLAGLAPAALAAPAAPAASSAPVAGIATVDFQRALNEVGEGTQARARLESMYADRKAAIERTRKDLETRMADLEKQKLVLSDAARRQKEEELMQMQAQFQATAQRAEQEMQQAYYGAMETLVDKMKSIAAALGKERGLALVLEVNEGGVVYAAPAIDLTPEVITRYNAANPVASPAPATPKK